MGSPIEAGGFTPGPWITGLDSSWSIDTDSGNTYIHVGPEGGDPVCIVIQTTGWQDDADRVDADARLIAASPDLLEAAQKALNFIVNTESEIGDTLDSGDLLRAAIAKATGGAA